MVNFFVLTNFFINCTGQSASHIVHKRNTAIQTILIGIADNGTEIWFVIQNFQTKEEVSISQIDF